MKGYPDKWPHESSWKVEKRFYGYIQNPPNRKQWKKLAEKRQLKLFT